MTTAPDLALTSSGPPWIFGQRGAPLEAPENTLISFERVLELGLDGLAYEARVAAGGEVVVFADATLERTTDGNGPIGEATLTKLATLDAGGSFDAAFQGERVPLLEEALSIARASLDQGAPQHLVFAAENSDIGRIRDVVKTFGARLSVRIASRSRDLCNETRDLGLSPLWIVDEAGEREFEIARHEKFAAIGAPIQAWQAARHVWPTERFALDVRAPNDLLWVARAPLHALTTIEPRRAFNARWLASLTREDVDRWPVRPPTLEVEPCSSGALRGDWSGSWANVVRVVNPFGFSVRVTCTIQPRRGAFDIERLPATFDLAALAERDVPFALHGGSWRVGGDPVFIARFSWRAGPGRRAGSIDLDAPLLRVRTARADALSIRLVLLRDGPRDTQASMTLRRHRRWLFVAIENPGGLSEARAIVSLAGREYLGSRGVRVPLPDDFDTRTEPLDFSCGIVAWRDGERIVRRFAGGLGPDLDRGSFGVLLRHSLGH
ncbi:MAG: glycerophosphodiester phosphodiesterase family protein [Planctomycetota bacterium]|nr:glycerophosphodiester phosphodiesterase family protein [Planctomycetota bacterium]